MFNFHLFDRDEDFDLLGGTLPGTLHFLFGDQLDRARVVLAGRSAQEIAYAIESLDWMLREGSQHLFAESMRVLKNKNHHVVNRVKALRAFMPHFDIANQSNLPNATWADYFAALTLAYITEALYAIHESTPPGGPLPEHESTPRHDPQTALDWASALEAMDAVCFAEHLLADSQRQTPPPASAAALGRKGGKMRTAKFSNLKDKVLGLYERKYHTCPSNREAARRILLELTEKDLSVLSTDNPQERFQKWIGTYKKAQDDKLIQRFLTS
jgi:hypothetical protein